MAAQIQDAERGEDERGSLKQSGNGAKTVRRLHCSYIQTKLLKKRIRECVTTDSSRHTKDCLAPTRFVHVDTKCLTFFQGN